MKRWHFWAGLIISALFLFLALRGLNLEKVWQEISSANLIWLVPGIMVYFLALIARAWRWQFLLKPVQNLKTIWMVPALAVGYMGNNIFPARAGELLSALFLKRKYRIPVSASLATILAERIFDGVVMLGFLFLNLSRFGHSTIGVGFLSVLQSLAFWGSIIFLSLLFVFLWMASAPQKAQIIMQLIINRILPKKWRTSSLQIFERFMSGLGALQSGRDVFFVFFLSLIIWLIETFFYWFVMRAFPFSISFFTLMMLLGVINLATTLPSAPGYIGTFDAMSIAFLTALGISPALSAGYTVVLHAALWLPITLVGLFFFGREGFKWSEGLQSEKIKGESSE